MFNAQSTTINTSIHSLKSLEPVINHNIAGANPDSNIQYEMETSTYSHLLAVEDGQNQRLIDLNEDTYNIGRKTDNSIVIFDRHVSRYQATILKKYSEDKKAFFYQIVDGQLNGKSSKNGLYINGKKCNQKYLEHGDFIRFSEKAAARYFVLIENEQIPHICKRINDQTREVENKVLQDTEKSTINLEQTFLHKLDEDQYDYLSKLASFSELSPYPIIEIDLKGKITYCNQAASLTFPNLQIEEFNHPILTNILRYKNQTYRSLFVREVTVKDQTFEQYIHYLPQLKLIRSYIFDFTKRKLIEEKLRDSEAKYKAVVTQINEGIFLVDAKTKKIVEANNAASELLGYSAEQLINFRIDDHFLVNKKQEFTQYLQSIKNGFIRIKELEYKHKKGHIIYVEISANIINYHQQKMICFVFRNITKRKQLEAKLKYTAYHDSLTKLYNRSFFNEYLNKALINAKRENYLMAIIFADLDYFKHINDNYGHKLGDKSLQEFAKRLQSNLRAGDIMGRWGGDEFTILLPKIETEKDVIQVVERISKSLQKPFVLGKKTIQISSSMGIAIYPQHGQDSTTLLHNADMALFCTKQRGRNGYSLYNSSMKNL